MDQPGGTNPLHDPRWTAIGSAIASLFAGAFVVWRELRGRMREGRRQRTEDAAKRADETWDQAAQLRGEYKELLSRCQTREEELRRELLARERDIDAKEHLIGNLRMREAARAARWNALRRELIERFPGGDYDHLEKWAEPNGGTKEVQKP